MKVKITTVGNMEYFKCKKDTIVEVPLEEYVAAVVASEIGNAPLEACKAQAVAARTFAVNRGVLEDKPILDTATKAQAYRASRNNYENCIKAAKETQGQILIYNNKPISAVYSHSNGGRTYSSEERWGTAYPYLIAQEDKWTTAKRNGHGVGLSQDGAINAAKAGIKYENILSFYYPRAVLEVSPRAVLSNLVIQIKKIMAEL